MPDWIPKEWTLELAYAACAGLGLFVVIVQLVLALFGGGADDLDEGVFDFEGDGGLDVLTVRGISSFLAVFGLMGWIGTAEGWPRVLTLFAALAAGSVVLFSVAMLLRWQRRLSSSGTIEASGAVGKHARVYLRIPAENKGFGKITVELQGRTAEYAAFTRGPELATGSTVRVVSMSAPGTFEVASLERNP